MRTVWPRGKATYRAIVTGAADVIVKGRAHLHAGSKKRWCWSCASAALDQHTRTHAPDLNTNVEKKKKREKRGKKAKSNMLGGQSHEFAVVNSNRNGGSHES